MFQTIREPEMECDYNILLTTRIGMEKISESIIEELFDEIDVKTMPRGYKGLILARHRDPDTALKRILDENPYVEKGFTIMSCCEAEPQKIAETAALLAEKHIDSTDTFAIRTNRRGKHNFTSIEVNILAGEMVRKKTGAQVDLDYPKKVVAVNIIDDKAYITILPGDAFYKKMTPGKKSLRQYYHKIIIAQEPYVGPPEASRKMGERIGRILQSYEVGQYIVAPIGPVEAAALKNFLQGLLDGVESRHRIQEKAYGKKTYRTKIVVQDMYAVARQYHEHPLIILEPEGQPVSKTACSLTEKLGSKKKPVFLLGSRTGVPSGLYRFADLIIDIAPGITLSTETAVSSLLSIIGYLLGGEGC